MRQGGGNLDWSGKTNLAGQSYAFAGKIEGLMKVDKS
jgi:hypothetical protein